MFSGSMCNDIMPHRTAVNKSGDVCDASPEMIRGACVGIVVVMRLTSVPSMLITRPVAAIVDAPSAGGDNGDVHAADL